MSTGPVARQGDSTAHGGTIVQGDPTLFVDGMPVATMGSMHVCPMCTGTVPHVGGPVSNGVSWFTVNGTPVATQGSVCTCNGPPDSIVMGSATLIVSSCGGGGGGRAGGSAVNGAVAAAAAAESVSPEATEREEHWLEFLFEDAAGNAASGVPYRLEDPDGNVSEEWMRGEGLVRRSGLSEGQGTVAVKAVHDAKWSTSEAKVGEEVIVTAKAKGFKDGTAATVQIKEMRAEGGPAATIAEIETEVSGAEVEATWTYEYPSEVNGARRSGGAGQRAPAFVAEVDVKGYPLAPLTGFLQFTTTVKFKLRNETTGEVLPDTGYRLRMASGEIREGTTDDNGKVTEEDVPLGPIEAL